MSINNVQTHQPNVNQQSATNTSLTMADETITRIDHFLSSLDLLTLEVVKGNGTYVNQAYAQAVGAWLNLEHNTKKVDPELHDRIMKLIEQLDQFDLRNLKVVERNTQLIRHTIVNLTRALHEAVNTLGLEVVIKVKKTGGV